MGLVVLVGLSSLEVEHDIETGGVFDVSQKSNESFKELSKVLGFRVSEHIVDVTMVVSCNLASKLDKSSFVFSSGSSSFGCICFRFQGLLSGN